MGTQSDRNEHASSQESPAGPSSLVPHYFEQMYRQSDDPWSFATSAYEEAKYTATLEALPKEQYQNAFEIGCSIGVLTYRLAARCDRLLAVDVVARALRQARARCRNLDHVCFQKMQVPECFPDDTFDLVVLSEVGYYWSPADLSKARRLIAAHLAPQGHLLLVHWTPYVEDYPLTGDEVHELFLNEGAPALRHRTGRRAEHYRLDLFEAQG